MQAVDSSGALVSAESDMLFRKSNKFGSSLFSVANLRISIFNP